MGNIKCAKLECPYVEAQAHVRYFSIEKAEYAMLELDTTATYTKNLISLSLPTVK